MGAGCPAPGLFLGLRSAIYFSRFERRPPCRFFPPRCFLRMEFASLSDSRFFNVACTTAKSKFDLLNPCLVCDATQLFGFAIGMRELFLA